jgi:hypothetical protein
VNHKAGIMLYYHQKFIPLVCGIRLAILDFVAGSSATAASVVVISNETLHKQIIILDKFDCFCHTKSATALIFWLYLAAS